MICELLIEFRMATKRGDFGVDHALTNSSWTRRDGQLYTVTKWSVRLSQPRALASRQFPHLRTFLLQHTVW